MTWAARHAGDPSGEGAGDEILMSAIWAGDRDAFAILMRRHARPMLAVARRISGTSAEAEEIVQEAFLKVWNGRSRWNPDSGARFGTWFYQVVVNLSIDRARRPSFAPIEAAGDPPDPAMRADETVQRDQRQAIVRAALAQLPPRQRAALALCYYQELSCADAAEILLVSVPAMESLLVRARRGLKAALQGMRADLLGGMP